MRKRLRSSIDEHENTSQEESQNDLVKENMFLGAIDDVNQVILVFYVVLILLESFIIKISLIIINGNVLIA